jgi:hypothetical protein
MRTVAVIKRQVILATPSNMTEMTKALSAIQADLDQRGIKYTDDTVTMESCDDHVLLWYDISDNLTEADRDALMGAAMKAYEAPTATTKAEAPTVKVNRRVAQASGPIPAELEELTIERAQALVETSGTSYFSLPSEQSEIAVLRSRVRTAARKHPHVLVETRAVRKPKSALEVTVVRD